MVPVYAPQGRANGVHRTPQQSTPNESWNSHPPSVSPSPLQGQAQLGPVGLYNQAYRVDNPRSNQPYRPYNGPFPGPNGERSYDMDSYRPTQPRMGSSQRAPFRPPGPGGGGGRPPPVPAPPSQLAVSQRHPTPEVGPVGTHTEYVDKPYTLPYKYHTQPLQSVLPEHNKPGVSKPPRDPMAPSAHFRVSANDIRFIDEEAELRGRLGVGPPYMGSSREYIASPAQSSVYGTPPESPSMMYRSPQHHPGPSETML